jgi:hypothetical protein
MGRRHVALACQPILNRTHGHDIALVLLGAQPTTQEAIKQSARSLVVISHRRSTTASRGFVHTMQHAHMEEAASKVDDHAPMEDVTPASVVEVDAVELEVAGILTNMKRLMRSWDRRDQRWERWERRERRRERKQASAVATRPQPPSLVLTPRSRTRRAAGMTGRRRTPPIAHGTRRARASTRRRG